MMEVLEIPREDMCFSYTDPMMIMWELFDNLLISMEQMDSVTNLKPYRYMQYLVFKEMSAKFAGWRCPELALHTQYTEAGIQTEAEEVEDNFSKEKRER